MKGYAARVILDSISPAGVRLTTAELKIGKNLLAELNTHRAFSKNAASSRAIPTRKMISAAIHDPAVPVEWGRNQPGMQASEQLSPARIFLSKTIWHAARFAAIAFAWILWRLNGHKQTVNRLIEPFVFATVLVTGTADAWGNFFFLRCAQDAQPELRHVAILMLHEYLRSTPRQLAIGEWHTPLILPDEEAEMDMPTRLRVSTGRCARLSYNTHHGKRDPAADLNLFERLTGGSDGAGHWSPTEHQATPLDDPYERSGNFRGWKQHRQMYAGQAQTWETFTQSDLFRRLVT